MTVTQTGQLAQGRDAYREYVRAAATVLGTTFNTVTSDVPEVTLHTQIHYNNVHRMMTNDIIVCK